MLSKTVVSIGIVGWCVIGADGARAAEVRLSGCAVPRLQASAAAGVTPADKAGLRGSIAAHGSGGLRVSAKAEGVDVQKIVFENGEFSVSIRSGKDLVTMHGNGMRVKVARGGRVVVFDLSHPEADRFDRTSILLAGSPALRAFRSGLHRMSADGRRSPQGVALDIVDVLFSVAQGDLDAPRRFRASHAPQEGVVTVGAGRSCYSEWKNEVLSAWSEYEACYNDFSWWSGGREGCAFLYTIEVESAWFRMIGCSAIPLNTN